MSEQDGGRNGEQDRDGRDRERSAVVAALTAAGRDSSAASVAFHSAIAAQQDLGATETKTLDLLERHGPLTAKELAEHSGLAPASVTGLVDRLERKGFVRRVKHPTDKRRVLIEPRPEKLAELAPLFDDWAREVHELYEEFTTEELATITRFLTGATERQRAATKRLVE
ncbi:DNA-binding MarR family transcriptional regulator [Streptomyces sp. PanSC19]|uniref:MarR family winged helix-turn-helix transcriptional regulator n=1 Tax=Streptomyces sp. PanSC19 TaxID=1520455 RepID=UPI000F4AD67B|nr:MarR family transcriptional regulator [Streptomyces sp. PanSC19]ROQ31711.1 DNA-binding MarR family transcriptional regulator [Streptomyces sp. PanSC19]